MLFRKTKNEYFGQKVECIYCIHVLLCISYDEEWPESYENPSQLARHDHNAMIESIDASCCLAFYVGVNSKEKCHGACKNISNFSITLKKIIGLE